MTLKRVTFSIVILLLVSLTAGCARYYLRIHNNSVQKPSNVAVYFSVEDNKGNPIPDLKADAFKIYEDGQLISPFESKQTILNPEVSVIHFVLILLDLSASITDSGALPTVIEAAQTFTDKMGKKKKVAIYGFDGGKKLIPIIRNFTSSASYVKSGLRRLRNRKAKDPSTNLHGAVIEASRLLEKRMERSKKPLRFGSLIVFTDGTDRAHRVTYKEMRDVVRDARINIFAIGIGPEISESKLAGIGRTGFVKASKQAKMGSAFNRIADYISASSKKYYILSYCSPSRAGVHKLEVVLTKKGITGKTKFKFDAAGFGPKCDPKKTPKFQKSPIQFSAAGRIDLP